MRQRAIPLLVLASLAVTACSSGGDDDTAVGATADQDDESSQDDWGDAGTVPAVEPTTSTPDTATGGASTDPVTAEIDPRTFEPASIAWEPYDEHVEVGTLDVPVDYADPGGPTVELFVARYGALVPEERIGTLLVNPGGPGFGGADMAVFASRVFDRELLDHFDIVGWDPRGTGESDPPIDCIADYDPYFTEIDTTPESAAERERVIEAAQEFADRCVESNATLIEHVGTNDSARDMDTIRRALGEDQISYFGFSYGSELGGVWATLFPETVRAAVLDGASDPTADSQESALQQLRGFDAALDVFLSECAADDECAFHNDGDPAAALDALLVELDETPAPTEDGRPPVNRDVAINGVLHAMYSERYWPALAESLSDAQQGDGSGLLALHDAYFQRFPDGTYGNELEAFQAISCADQAERPTIDEAEAESAELHAATPRLVPEGSIGFFCTFFPAALDPRAEITADGVGPVVVIGTTGDAATPLTSTAKMAEALPDGRLVVVEANEHTGYGVNRCVVEVVNQYLVELDAPDDGTECR